MPLEDASQIKADSIRLCNLHTEILTDLSIPRELLQIPSPLIVSCMSSAEISFAVSPL